MEAHASLLFSSITTAGPFRPGQTVGLKLVTDISDYFNMSDDPIVSTLNSGLTYVSGSASLTPVSVVGHDPTTINFDEGPLVGGQSGGTSVTLTYNVSIDEFYSGSNPVQGTDTINTTHQLTSDITPGGCGVVTTPTSPIYIGQPTFTKSVYAVNGNTTVPSPVYLRPGDVVTWRLTIDQFSGDEASVVLTDYLPMPIFFAEEHTTTPTFGGPYFYAGPANTVPAGTPVNISVSPSTLNNSVTFTYGAFQTDPTSDVTIDILMDYTVTDQPIDDLLTFVNIADGTLNGTGSSEATATLIAGVILHEPDLSLTLGITSTDNPATTFSPAAVAGPYNSTQIAATPVTSSVGNVDAYDKLEFTLIVQNNGSNSAYNLLVTDDIPTGLQMPSGGWVQGTNFFVTLGDLATNVPFTGSPSDLFGSGLNIPGPLDPYDPSNGTNLLVIRFELDVSSSVHAQEVLSNDIAQLQSFGSEASGGPNFAVSGPQYIGTANATIANFQLTDTLLTPASDLASIQDVATYQIAATIPEGTMQGVVLTATLPSGMAVTAVPTLTLPADVTATSTTPVVSNSGAAITWTLGTVTNSQTTNPSTQVILANFDAVVLNVAGNVTGTVLGDSATLSFSQGTSTTATATNVTVDEPKLTVTQSISPTTSAENGVVTGTVTITPKIPGNTAYNVTYTLPVPSAFSAVSGCSTVLAPAPTSCTYSGGELTITYASITTAQAPSFSYQLTVGNALSFGSSASLSSTTTWTTQASNTGDLSPYNTNSTERTGTDSPAVNSDFTSTVSTFTQENFQLVAVTESPLTDSIGSPITYLVTVTVPQGTNASSVLGVTFPATDNLAYLSSSGLTTTSGSTSPSPYIGCNGAGGGTCSLPVPTVGTNGYTASFNFGQIVNTNPIDVTNDTIQFTVNAILLNATNGKAGNTVQPTFTIGSPAVTAKPSIITSSSQVSRSRRRCPRPRATTAIR